MAEVLAAAADGDERPAALRSLNDRRVVRSCPTDGRPGEILEQDELGRHRSSGSHAVELPHTEDLNRVRRYAFHDNETTGQSSPERISNLRHLIHQDVPSQRAVNPVVRMRKNHACSTELTPRNLWVLRNSVITDLSSSLTSNLDRSLRRQPKCFVTVKGFPASTDEINADVAHSKDVAQPLRVVFVHRRTAPAKMSESSGRSRQWTRHRRDFRVVLLVRPSSELGRITMLRE